MDIKINDLFKINDYDNWTICLNNANYKDVDYTFSSKNKDRLMEHISYRKGAGNTKSFRNINTKYCLQFLRMDDSKKLDNWLFLGAFENKGIKISELNGFEVYDLDPLDKFSCYIERLIIEYKKHQGDKQAKIKAEMLDELNVVEILPNRYVEADRPFPGYNSLIIDFKDLSEIINKNVKNWKNNLTKVQCIYLIVDKSNGKQYVGSTYGYDGVWQRWSAYVDTKGAGGNKELKKIVERDESYAYDNFQFSILECFFNTDKDYISSRENHWKNVLMSRKHGYNEN